MDPLVPHRRGEAAFGPEPHLRRPGPEEERPGAVLHVLPDDAPVRLGQLDVRVAPHAERHVEDRQHLVGSATLAVLLRLRTDLEPILEHRKIRAEGQHTTGVGLVLPGLLDQEQRARGRAAPPEACFPEVLPPADRPRGAAAPHRPPFAHAEPERLGTDGPHRSAGERELLDESAVPHVDDGPERQTGEDRLRIAVPVRVGLDRPGASGHRRALRIRK
jgi:hypothetical protein